MINTRFTLTVLILLIWYSQPATAFEVKELHSTSSQPHLSKDKIGSGTNSCPWFYMYLNSKAMPRYGWLVNSTLM